MKHEDSLAFGYMRMASQKSNVAAGAAAAAPSVARAPQRQRGRRRVEALLDAAGAVFSEKGFEAATMTEIAQRAGAAIGSLYQFFPSKEALADALLERYAARFGAALDGIAADADDLTPALLARSLVAGMLALGDDRAAAIALIDARHDGADRRSLFRAGLRRQIASILRRMAERGAGRGLPPAKVEAAASVILHLLKAVPGFAAEDPAGRRKLLAETRAAIAAYGATLIPPAATG